MDWYHLLNGRFSLLSGCSHIRHVNILTSVSIKADNGDTRQSSRQLLGIHGLDWRWDRGWDLCQGRYLLFLRCKLSLLLCGELLFIVPLDDLLELDLEPRRQ
jgi:hypothetical protein